MEQPLRINTQQESNIKFLSDEFKESLMILSGD